MKKLILIAALAGGLLVPATASAYEIGSPAHIKDECGNNPSKFSVEEWTMDYPPTREWALEEFVPYPPSFGMGSEEEQREAEWQKQWASWLNQRADLERDKLNDQADYDDCVGDVRAEVEEWEDEEREDAAEQRRFARQRRAAAKLRCKRVGGRNIWKSRASIPCKTARALARHSKTHRRYAGWTRTSYVHGFADYRIEHYTDSSGELHFYRVNTDPYMQAIWRNGKGRRVTIGTNGCEGLC